jgi:serine/threonine-protein kinase HipA
VRLNVSRGEFVVVDRGGRFIIKPQSELYRALPENEDLTMRLARTVGIVTPLSGLLRCKDGAFSYFIKRFDRRGLKRVAVEDFAQLSGATRDTKYSSSMERVAAVLSQYCTFPAVERVELMRRTLFCFLTGNEDMHLKNFSLICEDEQVRLSPAYDLLNTTLALPGAQEELALPLNGKKRRFVKNDLLRYFAKEKLQLNEAVLSSLLNDFSAALPSWAAVVHRSFLPAELQKRYLEVVRERCERMGFGILELSNGASLQRRRKAKR